VVEDQTRHDTLTIPRGNNVSGRAGELRERHTASQGKSLSADMVDEERVHFSGASRL
jgi:hypothetical protein